MSEHVTHLLNSFYDQELSAADTRVVENHLARCSQCQVELERIGSLSLVLNLAPMPGTLTTTESFLAQLNQDLTPRKQTAVYRILYLGWALLPGGLAALWGFVQAVFVTAFLFGLGLYSGFFPDLAAVIPGDSPSLLSTLFDLPALSAWSDSGQYVLRILAIPDMLLHGILIYAALQLVIGILFLAWMTSWFLFKSRKSLQVYQER
jgi:hypothetical protein